jgi:hypothetical protein
VATVYKVEIVSHWVNYSPEDIEKKLTELLKEDGNEYSVRVNKNERPRKV